MIELFKSVADLSNSEYHAVREGSERAYSSSQLKEMLKDPEVFYRTYITKEIVSESVPAFDVGTYIHTAILEPEKLDSECAIYTGAVRRGAAWDAFQAANTGKAILTMSEVEKATNAINGIRNSPIAQQVYSGGAAEVSIFIEVAVLGGEIYCELPSGTILMLGKDGWVSAGGEVDLSTAVRYRIKCRADYIVAGEYIADIKSTTGDPKNAHSIQSKVRDYQYDMSAALYLDVFNAGAAARDEKACTDFLWTFATKDYAMSRTWAASKKQLQVGRAKWKKAAIELAKYIANDWQFIDEVLEVEPASFEDDWLVEKKEAPMVRFCVAKSNEVEEALDL